MKKLEFVQTAYWGGWPVQNGEGFEHGEGVYIVNKIELDKLLNDALNYILHVGSNHTEKGLPHPQAWLVKELQEALK